MSSEANGRLVTVKTKFHREAVRPGGINRSGANMASDRSVKAMQRQVEAQIEEAVVPLVDLLRGWTAYFHHGTRLMAYRAADHYVYDRVRAFLVKRHKVSSRGTRHFSYDVVYGQLGVLRLRDVHLGFRRVP